MSFKAYLLGLNYSELTIAKTLSWSLNVEAWFLAHGVKFKEASRALLLSYLSSRSSVLNRTSLLKEHKRLSLYCSYQGMENPFLSSKVGGRSVAVEGRYWKSDELEELYQSYSGYGRSKPLGKVLLGLLIYQGLSLDDLLGLEVGDLNWDRGQLDVRDRKLLGRSLPLSAVQLPLLLAYSSSRRGSLLGWSSRGHGSNACQGLLAQLRDRLGYGLGGVGDFRRSRIALWIKHEGLLRAQYLAGHRHLVATERYDQGSLADLRQAFMNNHPMYKK